MENEKEVVTDCRNKSEVEMPDLSSSQKSHDVTGEEFVAEASPHSDEVVVEDVWSDQPTSMLEVQSDEMVGHPYVALDGNSQPVSSSNETQEVPESVAELDLRTPTFVNSEETNPEELNVEDRKGPTEFEYKKGEILYSDIDVAMSENEHVSGNEPTPGSENAPNETMSYSPNAERQRPTRTTRRPTCFRDSDFETQFQPRERKRKCNRLRRKDQTGNTTTDTFHSCAENNPCFRFGRGVKQKVKKKKSGCQQEAD